MSLLKRALEGEIEGGNVVNTGDKEIELKGPLADVYTEALQIVYAKENPTDGSIATESNDNKKKKKQKPFKIKKGGFHEWLGKKPGEPITEEDIEKGLKSSDPHVRKMAQFAKNSKKFKHKKKNKISKEEINDDLSFEDIDSICTNQANVVAATISVESQQIDVAIMQKLADSIASNDPVTDNYQTVYGVSADDVDEDTVIDVTNELANVPENGEMVLVLDATDMASEPNETNNMEVKTVDIDNERTIELTSALESVVKAHGFKVYRSFKDYANSLK